MNQFLLESRKLSAAKATSDVERDVGDAVTEYRREQALRLKAQPAAGNAADEREKSRHNIESKMPT